MYVPQSGDIFDQVGIGIGLRVDKVNCFRVKSYPADYRASVHLERFAFHARLMLWRIAVAGDVVVNAIFR